MTNREKRWLKYALIVAAVVLLYIGLVYAYFQYETFKPNQPDPTVSQVVWYVFLNPTGLGNVGNLMSLPTTLVGKTIAFVFTLTSLGLLGVFIGKIGDMFTEYREYRRLGHAGTNFEDHIVILGWDKFARMVTDQLVLSGQQVAIVTDEKDDIDVIYEEFGHKSVFVLYSLLNDYGNLDKVNIRDAFRVLINEPSDAETLVELINIKALEEGSTKSEEADGNGSKPNAIDCVVTFRDEDLENTYLEAGAYAAISLHESASNLIASNIFEPQSAELLGDLIASVENGEEHELQQYRVTSSDAVHGRTFGEVFDEIYEKYDSMPVGVSKPADQGRKIHKLPDDDLKLESGDYLLIVVSGSEVARMERALDVEQGLHPEDSGRVE
jgi:voltage-gated potassium channel